MEEFSCGEAADFLKSKLGIKIEPYHDIDAVQQMYRFESISRKVTTSACKAAGRSFSVEEQFAQASIQQQFGVPELGSPAEAITAGYQLIPTLPQVTNTQKVHQIQSVAAG